jgi:hypothetical protein
MTNITLLSLVLSRSSLSSPLFSLPRTRVPLSFSLHRSSFSHLLSPILVSQPHSFLSVTHSAFNAIQSSAIRVSSEGPIIEDHVEYQSIATPVARDQGSLVLKCCVFARLHHFEGGGALYFHAVNEALTISECGFRACRGADRGGALFANCRQLRLLQCCFDQCISPDKGQSMFLQVETSESDELCVHKCSMERPSGDSESISTSGGVLHFRTSNISHNFVASSGAAFGVSEPKEFELFYAMVSENYGNSIFSFANAGGSVKIGHCSLLRNHQVESPGFFGLNTATLTLDQCNFVDNKFVLFANGGRISIQSKIVTDFSLTTAVVVDCVLINPENAFKVLWVDAGMKHMETWLCWAMGSSSPSPSQSPPPYGAGGFLDSGIFLFLVISVVVGVPVAFGYVYWTERQPPDLAFLEDLPISNT